MATGTGRSAPRRSPVVPRCRAPPRSRSMITELRGTPIMRLRRDRRGRGQALVEFALVIPIFLLLLIAIFDMGRAVFAYNTLTNAAREGARIAIVNQYKPSVLS